MSESRPVKRKIEFIESYLTGDEIGSDYQWNDNHGELIRCYSCKYFRWDEWCSEMHKETKPNDYCSWAVKKDE